MTNALIKNSGSGGAFPTAAHVAGSNLTRVPHSQGWLDQGSSMNFGTGITFAKLVPFWSRTK